MPGTTPPPLMPQAGRDARCAALFASALQPSEAPAAAITSAVQRLGPRGCTERMAQESVITPTRQPAGCAGRVGSPPSTWPGFTPR
jgi:hypothetical protein